MADITTQPKKDKKAGKPIKLLLKAEDQAIKSQIDATIVLDSNTLRVSGILKSLDLKHTFKDEYDFSGWIRFNVELYNDGHIRFRLRPPNIDMIATADTTIKGGPAGLFNSQDLHMRITKVLYDALYQIAQGHDKENAPIGRTAELTFLYGGAEVMLSESDEAAQSAQRSMEVARTGASTLADAIRDKVARNPDGGLLDMLRSHREFGFR